MSLSCACPEHYPDWDGKDINLGGQCVHTLSIPMFLHMPLSYEVYLKRQYNDIQGLQLKEPWPGLVLTRTGMFRGTIMRLLQLQSLDVMILSFEVHLVTQRHVQEHRDAEGVNALSTEIDVLPVPVGIVFGAGTVEAHERL